MMSVVIYVSDEELPEYPDGCPMSKVYYMDDENTDKTVSVMEEFGVNVTGEISVVLIPICHHKN